MKIKIYQIGKTEDDRKVVFETSGDDQNYKEFIDAAVNFLQSEYMGSEITLGEFLANFMIEAVADIVEEIFIDLRHNIDGWPTMKELWDYVNDETDN